MKLEKIRIKNFRGYNDEIDVSIGNMTAFVGPNDAGKSSILEALDIFFNDSGGVVKMGKNDLNVKQKGGDSPEVEIACVFSDLPETIAIDSSNGTSLNLKQNYMLNSDGLLEIVKKYSMTSESPRATVSIKALHPGNPNCSNLLSKTQEELRGILDQFNISCDDRRKCSSMRSAIWEHFSKDLGLREELIDISTKSGQGSDLVWNCLKRALPVYSLFRSDRKNSDGDSEVQDPLREAVKEILRDGEIQNKLDDVAEKVRARLQDVTDSTLAKLEEMDSDVAGTLKPQIPSTGDLKWADVFKGLSITGDENIPINKRGSGVRRLVLINFFRAEVESKAERTNSSVIYAIEEPETSQHVQNQKKLVSALKELSKKFHTQIIVTTHSSTVVRCLDYEDIRIVNGDHSISAIQSEGRNTKTLLEVNYLAFGDATAEYHNELYDEIQKKLGVDTVSGFEGKVKEKKIFDAYMKRHNGLTGEDEILTLQSYIRNCIHHPGNSRKPEYTPAQITQSIVEMRRYLGEQHDKEHQSSDHQPEMGK